MKNFTPLLTSLLLISHLTSSQTPDTTGVQRRIRDRLVELGQYLSDIANPNTPDADKQQAIEQTLGMFLKGSTIQVSSVKNPRRINTYSLGEYLQNLSLLGYGEVALTFGNVSVRPTGGLAADSTQPFVATFRQGFRGRNGKRTYADVTTKTVGFVIMPKKDPFSGNTDSYLLLKNIQIAN